MSKLYKYFSPNILEFVFDKSSYIKLKCSLPKDYNDPYELFLTVDTKRITPDALAYYLEVIGEIPQYPTTCFAKRPTIMPMWAHYALNSTGFAIEFNEESLLTVFKEAFHFDDVSYEEENNFIDSTTLEKACYRGKPRDRYILTSHVLGRAYFTKASSWAYEQERRLIISDKSILDIVDNVMLLSVPINCISAIIAGAKISDEQLQRLLEFSQLCSVNFFKMRLSKISFSPFFSDIDNRSYAYDGNAIISVDHHCLACGEPLDNNCDEGYCLWCSVDDSMRKKVFDPFLVLHDAGLLSGYLKAMNAIGKIPNDKK